jgi:hypothetical protein
MAVQRVAKVSALDLAAISVVGFAGRTGAFMRENPALVLMRRKIGIRACACFGIGRRMDVS